MRRHLLVVCAVACSGCGDGLGGPLMVAAGLAQPLAGVGPR